MTESLERFQERLAEVGDLPSSQLLLEKGYAMSDILTYHHYLAQWTLEERRDNPVLFREYVPQEVYAILCPDEQPQGENVSREELVRSYLERDPFYSTREISERTGIPRSTVSRIRKKLCSH